MKFTIFGAVSVSVVVGISIITAVCLIGSYVTHEIQKPTEDVTVEYVEPTTYTTTDMEKAYMDGQIAVLKDSQRVLYNFNTGCWIFSESPWINNMVPTYQNCTETSIGE